MSRDEVGEYLTWYNNKLLKWMNGRYVSFHLFGSFSLFIRLRDTRAARREGCFGSILHKYVPSHYIHTYPTSTYFPSSANSRPRPPIHSGC